jgi:hypothetical protein
MGLLTDLLEKKIESKHRDEEDKKERMRSFYYDRIHDDNTDPAVREQISQDYLKLLSPDAKKQAQQGMGMLAKLKSAFTGGPKQPQQGQQPQQPSGPVPPPSNPPPAGMAGLPDQNDPNAQPATQAPGQQKPPAQPTPAAALRAGPQFFKDYGLAAEARKDERTGKLADDAGLKGRDKALFVASGGTKLPPDKTTTVKAIARDGVDPDTGKPYDGLWDHTVGPDKETWAKRPEGGASGRPTILSSDVVTLDHAQKLGQAGVKYHDAEGKEIDLSQVPQGMVLQAIHRGDKTYYVPRDVQDKVVDVNGIKYAVSPFEVQGLPQGAGTALGLKNAPTSSTHQVMAVDAQGNPTTNTLTSTRTPQAGGIAGRPGGAPPTPGAQAKPVPPPNAPQPPQPKGGNITPHVAQAPPAKPMNMTPGMYNNALKRIGPIREAATQIFGDPSQPDLKGLISYGQIADKPESREKLGKALKLTLDGMDEATGGAHISASAGPISVGTGGVGSVLTNYFGVPQKVADQQNKIMEQAVAGLSPEEREAYDSTISSLSTIVGLRASTGAPATNTSIRTIERELPVIGVNTFDSKQFADKMQRLAEVVNNGAKGVPRSMLGEDMHKRIEGLPTEMQKLKGGSPAKAPKGDGKAPKTADDFFKQFPELAPK